MNNLEELLLEAMQLLAEAKPHVARDMTIGGQKCSQQITDFLSTNRHMFFALQAKKLGATTE